MLKRIWRTCCSLKLAIILASAATLITMGGSLVMHFNPPLFGNLDTTTLAEWTRFVGRKNPVSSWWFYLNGILVLLLGLNTACCFIDWLLVFRSRWRKSGEYLIHLGFVLVVSAYFWGSLAGARSADNRIAVGETIPLAVMPGYDLRLDNFEPVFNEQRRPVDMRSTLSLLQGDHVVASKIVKTNTPLLYRGLVVVPSSYDQQTIGFEVLVPGVGKGFRLTAGDAIPFQNGYRLVADAFFPDAVISGGRIVNQSHRIGQPAYLVRLLKNDVETWRGWYFLTRPLPQPLREIGFGMVINRPVTRPVSILTINYDPGAFLALIGGISISFGVVFALFSFYYKRSRGDRPYID